MPRPNAFKANASFFRMIALGAVGAQIVQDYLNALGHEMVELERGSLSTKIWKDVKRKRVRIPDLCCKSCGVRVESRAKTRPDLRMSHSTQDAERAWDYGMLDSDWIAFPVLTSEEDYWSTGGLDEERSLWRERILTSWKTDGYLNLFEVKSFRDVSFERLGRKGVTEGSEVQIKWPARFAPEAGRITLLEGNKIHFATSGTPERRRHFRLGSNLRPTLDEGATFERHQVLAAQAPPLSVEELHCPGGCDSQRIERMLRSRERTSRFTGCKLARLARSSILADTVRELAQDAVEDMYVRMEARSFLCAVAGEAADVWFGETLLHHPDDQMRLEAVVALAEVQTSSAFELLSLVMGDQTQPLYLRSASAWAIGCHRTPDAAECLVRAFADISTEVRSEALAAFENLADTGIQALVAGLGDRSGDIAAGSAEAIRRIGRIPGRQVESIVELAENGRSTWPAWALGHLPFEDVKPFIATLQDRRPEVHFALSVLWTFLESWISRDWSAR